MKKEVAKTRLALSFVAVFVVGMASFAIIYQITSGYLFRHDGAGYFLYAVSIVTDFDTEVTDDYLELDAYVPVDSPALSGLRTHREPNPTSVILPWPIGAGLVMAPFYAVGYGLEVAVAAASGREANPFGAIPQVFFAASSLVYGWLGLWATYSCCRRIAEPRIATMATLGMMLGGPAVYYIFFHPSMAHASSFGLVALFILLWWRRWDGEPVSIVWLGALSGLLVMVRYQNAVFGILLAALLVSEVRTRGLALAVRSGLTASGACLALLSLQAFHLWKIERVAASHYWQTESMVLGDNPLDLSSPFFFDVLFSCRHGAITWAPIIAFGFLGLVVAWRGNSWSRLLVCVFLLDVYLVGSLRGPVEILESLDAPPSDLETNWSGGHAFGMRYLTECASLLAIGLAVWLKRLGKGVGRIVWPSLVGLLVVVNGLLLMAYGLGTIDRVGGVTYAEMAAGIVEALGRLLGR